MATVFLFYNSWGGRFYGTEKILDRGKVHLLPLTLTFWDVFSWNVGVISSVNRISHKVPSQEYSRYCGKVANTLKKGRRIIRLLTEYSIPCPATKQSTPVRGLFIMRSEMSSTTMDSFHGFTRSRSMLWFCCCSWCCVCWCCCEICWNMFWFMFQGLVKRASYEECPLKHKPTIWLH